MTYVFPSCGLQKRSAFRGLQILKGGSDGNNTETMSRFRTVQEFEILYLQMPRMRRGERNFL